MEANASGRGLDRALGFWAIVAFGVGDILGAGIYALVGSVAAEAGRAAWASFGIALVVATLTALSYSEWSARVPRSAGEAAFLHQAFRRPWLPLLVGWMVLFSGMVSMATVTRVCADYVHALGVEVPSGLVMAAFVTIVASITWRGIRHSSAANVLCTVIELAGLVVVVVAALIAIASRDGAVVEGAALADIPIGAILTGGALSFFAFIGFEDMVNVAEEVREPRRTLPRAILVALGIAGALYMLVTWLSIEAVGPDALAKSKTPLLEVVRRGAPAVPDALFTGIALFAVANTALLNFVMGSRLLYGMGRYRLLPRALAKVHPIRRTPTVAIATMLVLVTFLAIIGTVVSLAGTTSTLLLLVFFSVNVGLIVVKRRGDPIPSGGGVSTLVPFLGAGLSLGLIGWMPSRSLTSAAAIVAGGVGLVLIREFCVRRARRPERGGPTG